MYTNRRKLAFPLAPRQNDGMDTIAEFRAVVRVLQTANVDFTLCGGIAMAVHGLPRLTKDIDILMQPDDVDRAFDVLEPLGFDFDSGLIPFKTATVQRITKVVDREYLMLDLMIVNDWLTPIWKSRVLVDWEGLQVPVVSATGLARMKRAAGRLQDLADIERLGFDINDPIIQPD